MTSWIRKTWKTILTKRVAAPLIALALAASFATYEVAKPLQATAAAAAAPSALRSMTTALPHCFRSIAPWKPWRRG